MCLGAQPPQDSGPRPGIAPKNLRMRESDRARIGPAAFHACAKVACLRWGETWPGVGPGSLSPAGGAQSQTASASRFIGAVLCAAELTKLPLLPRVPETALD